MIRRASWTCFDPERAPVAEALDEPFD